MEHVTLPKLTGGECSIAVQNPLAALAQDLEISPCLRDALRGAISVHPIGRAHKWTIVVYSDGINPADGLAKNHSRKCCTWYWSILEFGEEWLFHEELWYELTTVRLEGVIDSIEGGYARVTAAALDFFLRMAKTLG